jgi:hypothetical protein
MVGRSPKRAKPSAVEANGGADLCGDRWSRKRMVAMNPEDPLFVDAANVTLPGEEHLLRYLFCPRPTVRILFYTDSLDVNLNVNQPDFGVVPCAISSCRTTPSTPSSAST